MSNDICDEQSASTVEACTSVSSSSLADDGIQLKHTPLLSKQIVHRRCHYSFTWLLLSEFLQRCIGGSSIISLAIPQEVSCFGLWLVIVHVATVEADGHCGHTCRRILFRCAFGGSSSTSLTVPQSHPPQWLTMAFN